MQYISSYDEFQTGLNSLSGLDVPESVGYLANRINWFW